MSVDPVDDSTFWYTQEYYSVNSATGWKTRIGSFKLVADTTPPAAPAITTPAADGYNTTGNVTLGGTAEAGSTVEVFDGATSKGTTTASGGGTWSKSLTGVPDGVHAYTAKATDAGGTSPASNTRTITVDTTPPDTIVDSGPSGTTSASYAIFSFHSPDGTATLECRLDGPGSTTGLWGACASPKTYTGLASGAYTFSARATDPAGNTDPIPATDTWTVGSSYYRDAVTGTSGLIAYWRLGDASGTTATDQLLGHPGSYLGSPALGQAGALTGDPDTSVRFDGVDDAVNVPDDGALSPTSVTVELWARSDGTTWNDSGWLLSHRNGYMLFPVAASRTLRWYVHTSGAWHLLTYAPADITVWHHYVGTYDAATGVSRLYVDGVAVRLVAAVCAGTCARTYASVLWSGGSVSNAK